MKMKHKFVSVFNVHILLGAAISVGIALAMVAVFAWLIHSERIELNAVPAGANVILFLSALGGAFWIGRGEKGLVKALLSGFAFWLVLGCGNGLLLDGIYSGAMMGLAIIMAASALPGILNILPKKNRSKRRRKNRNR